MKKEFSYFRKGDQYFPIIDVKLENRGMELGVKALIDSGASYSVFRIEIADYLGVVIEKGMPIYLTGLGGRILGYLHTLEVVVDGKRFKCKIVFSEELTVSFNILGRDNFFVPFIISFSEKEKKVILSSAD